MSVDLIILLRCTSVVLFNCEFVQRGSQYRDNGDFNVCNPTPAALHTATTQGKWNVIDVERTS
jgi:hypothetical protein